MHRTPKLQHELMFAHSTVSTVPGQETTNSPEASLLFLVLAPDYGTGLTGTGLTQALDAAGGVDDLGDAEAVDVVD